MKRLAMLVVLGACHDWSSLSDHFDAAPDVANVDAGDPTSCVSRGPSICPSGANVIVCDGFENGFNTAVWNQPQPTSTIPVTGAIVDDTCVFRGANSLHVHGDVVEAGSYLRGDIATVNAIVVPTDAYVRAYFYVSQLPSQPLRLLNFPLQAANDVILLEITGGTLSVRNDFDPGGVTPSSVQFQAGRWTCLELEVKQGKPGEVRVWSDGAPAFDLKQTANPSPNFDKMLVGPLVNAPDDASLPSFDVWIDEVQISTQPIGCL